MQALGTRLEPRSELARSMRREPTKTEKIFWRYLRERKMLGLKFRRQRPLGRYFADFCCDEIQFIIEIDGGIHDSEDAREYDSARDEMLAAYGYAILRIKAEDVLNDLLKVLELIESECRRLMMLKSALPGTVPLSTLRERG